MTQRSKSGCIHEWSQAHANLPVADVGFWRYRCLRCGAYMNDGGRVVEPKP